MSAAAPPSAPSAPPAPRPGWGKRHAQLLAAILLAAIAVGGAAAYVAVSSGIGFLPPGGGGGGPVAATPTPTATPTPYVPWASGPTGPTWWISGPTGPIWSSSGPSGAWSSSGPSGVWGSSGPSGVWGSSGASAARTSPPSGSGLVPRAAAPMAWDGARQNLVLFSGYSPYQPGAADTWTWTKAGGWKSRAPAHRPTARAYATMAYDEASKLVILFGGVSEVPYDSRVLNDTWAWDGSDWRQLAPAHSPSPRVYAPAVYSPELRKLVLTGGGGPNGEAYFDTWLWDGADWSPLSTATGVRASVLGFRASDRSVVALENGASTCGPMFVSRLAGGSWASEYGGPNPPVQCWGGGVWDPQQERFIVAGGTDSTGRQLSTTMSWKGVWKQEPSGSLPPVGVNGLPPSAAWDPADRVVVLFGGGLDPYSSSFLQGTWLWDGSGWKPA